MKESVRKDRQDRLGVLLLWGTLALFVLTVFFVNPFRETAVEDDWAYALTVKGLLDTGHYRTHDWISANMPFQAHWGGLFTYLPGYSLANLRVSTLALAFVGLIAFFFLAREHGLESFTAGLLTLILLSSPLFLLFSFSFMTDVPFLVLLILAILFYTRSLRVQSYFWIVLASIAASAAILTRQFGMVIVTGVFFAWFFGGRSRQDALLVLVGLALPVAASMWQLYAGMMSPNWGARFHVLNEWEHISKLIPVAVHALWRPGPILQYLALFAIPLVLAAAAALPYELRSGKGFLNSHLGSHADQAAKRDARLFIEIGIYVVLCMLWARSIMPMLMWNLGDLSGLGLPLRLLLTVVTATGAVLFVRIFLMRYLDHERWSALSPAQRILDFVTLFLLLLHLVFCYVGDRYLLDLLPFTLIVGGAHLQQWLLHHKNIPLVASVLVLIISAMWTRASLEESEAYWKAADLVRKNGVEVSVIYGVWTWDCYHGDFDNYLVDIDYRPRTSLKDFFHRWRPEHRNRATYLVPSPDDWPTMKTTPFAEICANEKWELIGKIPYRDIFFRERTVFVTKKMPR